jgi:hypothetical protein
MSEPVLREATADDDVAIAGCIGEAFPDNPKARVDVLRWQYRDNPFGPSPSWVWDDDGRIVGHYTAYPMPYLTDGVPGRAGNAVDAAIAPSHQGRRLFTPLAEALYRGCAANGLPIAICYASNEVAMRGVAKAGVHWMPRLRTVVLAANDAWLGRRFHVPATVAGIARRAAFGLGRGPAADEVDRVPDGIDALWQHTVRAGPVRNGVDRGEQWWRWRYEQSPLGPYRYFALRRGGRLTAAAVVTVRDDFGGRFAYLLEYMAEDGDAGKALLRTITSAIDGISGVASIAVDRGPLHRLAKDAGMRTLPARLEPKGAWYGFVDTVGSHAHLVHSSWHIGWGDLDHL